MRWSIVTRKPRWPFIFSWKNCNKCFRIIAMFQVRKKIAWLGKENWKPMSFVIKRIKSDEVKFTRTDIMLFSILFNWKMASYWNYLLLFLTVKLLCGVEYFHCLNSMHFHLEPPKLQLEIIKKWILLTPKYIIFSDLWI